jgi:hypothetical protein
MPNETVQFWLDNLASLATLAALLVVIYEARSFRDADQRQAAFDYMEKWQELISDGKGKILEFEPAETFFNRYKRGSKEFSLYVRSGNYFESMGEAAFHNLINRQMAFEMMGQIAIETWLARKEIVELTRAKNNNPRAWMYFEWFALEARKAEPTLGNTLVSLTGKLRQEVQL